MSWVALKIAMATDTRVIIQNWELGCHKPREAMEPINNNCVSSIHPRRRPNQGNEYRSRNGDQMNLSV
jgi:hypothetical protein